VIIIEIFRLFGSILVDSSKAEESISKTEKKADGLGTKLGNGIKTAAKWGAAIGAGATAAGGALLALANKTAESADEIDKLSERTGINREELQRWKYAAEQSGADVGKLEGGIKKLSDVMDDAMKGSEKSVQAFDKIGISMDDLKNKSQSDIFDDVMNALAEMPAGAERNALGNDLLGKSYTEMLPLLNAGADGMDDLKNRADELGLVMSEEAVKANVKFGDTMADVKGAVGAVFMQLSNEFLPILQNLLDWILAHMPEIKEVISVVFNVITTVVTTVYNLFSDYILPVLSTLFSWIQENMPIIKEVTEKVFDVIWKIVNKVWSLFNNNLLPILKALWDFISPTFPLIQGVVEVTFGAIVKTVETVISVFERVTEAIKTAVEWLGSWNKTEAKDKDTSFKSGKDYDGSHASGLPYVPYDGYVAEVHKGERIMTAAENEAYSSGVGTGGGILITGNQFTVREETDIKKIARELYKLQQKSERGAGYAPA